MHHLRLATLEDIDTILFMYEAAKARLKESGIDQWQQGYPNLQSVELDLENKALFVLERDHIVVASVMMTRVPEPTYQTIHGAWREARPYIVVHRFVTHPRILKQGVGASLFEAIQAQSEGYIRVDTHEDNVAMNQLLLKKGFHYCGIITLSDGSTRLAYDWVQ